MIALLLDGIICPTKCCCVFTLAFTDLIVITLREQVITLARVLHHAVYIIPGEMLYNVVARVWHFTAISTQQQLY